MLVPQKRTCFECLSKLKRTCPSELSSSIPVRATWYGVLLMSHDDDHGHSMSVWSTLTLVMGTDSPVSMLSLTITVPFKRTASHWRVQPFRGMMRVSPTTNWREIMTHIQKEMDGGNLFGWDCLDLSISLYFNLVNWMDHRSQFLLLLSEIWSVLDYLIHLSYIFR